MFLWEVVSAEEQRHRTAELTGGPSHEPLIRGIEEKVKTFCDEMCGDIHMTPSEQQQQQVLAVAPDLPIITLMDSSENIHASNTTMTATKELKLLDFGFAPRDHQHAQLESKDPLPKTNINNTNSEELSFGLQLFNRDTKKRRP